MAAQSPLASRAPAYALARLGGRPWFARWLMPWMNRPVAARLHGIDWGLPQVYEEAQPFKKAWSMWIM